MHIYIPHSLKEFSKLLLLLYIFYAFSQVKKWILYNPLLLSREITSYVCIVGGGP